MLTEVRESLRGSLQCSEWKLRESNPKLSHVLAAHYGVSSKTIQDIWNRKAWAHAIAGIFERETINTISPSLVQYLDIKVRSMAVFPRCTSSASYRCDEFDAVSTVQSRTPQRIQGQIVEERKPRETQFEPCNAPSDSNSTISFASLLIAKLIMPSFFPQKTTTRVPSVILIPELPTSASIRGIGRLEHFACAAAVLKHDPSRVDFLACSSTTRGTCFWTRTQLLLSLSGPPLLPLQAVNPRRRKNKRPVDISVSVAQ
jgi:hypothetical protein